MIRIAALALVLLSSLPVEARPRRVIRLPPVTITCDSQCRADSERLARVMELVKAGKLRTCGDNDPNTLWVRLADVEGECRRVPMPKARLTGWRR